MLEKNKKGIFVYKEGNLKGGTDYEPYGFAKRAKHVFTLQNSPYIGRNERKDAMGKKRGSCLSYDEDIQAALRSVTNWKNGKKKKRKEAKLGLWNIRNPLEYHHYRKLKK